jgi:hypothetical protein
MSPQIIEVRHALFMSLLRHQSTVHAELWNAGFDTVRRWRDAVPQCILIDASIDRYGLGHRPIFQDNVIAIAIVRTGLTPCIWPRPLPDDVTKRLLDALEPIMCSIEDLSAHQRLELAAAFESARQTPAMGAEALTSIPPRTTRQRRLRMHGLQLSQKFHDELSRLDARVTGYAHNVRRTDLEECIAALSSHSELGIRLRLRPGSESADSCANLLTISRRPSLEALMETVAGLSDATLHALAIHAPHSARYDPAITMTSLAHIQSIVTNAAHRQTRNPWRSYDRPDATTCRSATLDLPVPSIAVLDAANRWTSESDRRRWVGVHALVAAAILHVEFIRTRPFESGNGRVGRILFQSHLHASGWPILPWSFAFELLYDDYQAALQASLKRKSYEPFSKFVVEACDVAVAKGEIMVPAMQREREVLLAAISADRDIYPEDARLYAEALLGSVALEGFSSGRALQNNRELLRRLHATGAIDRIRTPIGAVFSSHVSRELMKTQAVPMEIVGRLFASASTYSADQES